MPSNPPLLKTPTTSGLVEEEYEEKEDEEFPPMKNILKEEEMVWFMDVYVLIMLSPQL